MALLAARDRHGHPAVSWVHLIVSDMVSLRRRLPAVCEALPDPENGAQEWFDYIYGMGSTWDNFLR
eukprot:15606122-Heterocapsa_arctica.AAC.1